MKKRVGVKKKEEEEKQNIDSKFNFVFSSRN